VKVLNVFDRFKAIAFGDAAAITQYMTGACRYCHGIGHRHHWKTHCEFADAMQVYMGKGKLHYIIYAAPDDEGGYGYRFSDAPHPDCPET
jgi:phage terminase small subunit